MHVAPIRTRFPVDMALLSPPLEAVAAGRGYSTFTRDALDRRPGLKYLGAASRVGLDSQRVGPLGLATKRRKSGLATIRGRGSADWGFEAGMFSPGSRSLWNYA